MKSFQDCTDNILFHIFPSKVTVFVLCHDMAEILLMLALNTNQSVSVLIHIPFIHLEMKWSPFYPLII